MPNATLAQLVRDGRAAFDRGDFRAARTHFEQSARKTPDDTGARFWLAAAQYHLGNVHLARPVFEELVAAGAPPVPDRAAAVHEYLARCMLTNDPALAAAVAETGSDRDPQDARVRFVLGNALLRQGRPDEALRRLDEALAREPESAAYHNRRGVILFEGLEDAAGAVRSARRAVELDPDTNSTGRDGAAHRNLAVYLERMGDHREALAAVERALAISPQREYKALRDRRRNGVPTAPAAAPFSGPASPSAALTFAGVGGMQALKEQVRRIMDVILTKRDDARRYGIERNGVLLYGPPGCGKTFFAEAIAGEFGLAFIRVSLGDAQTQWVGGAAAKLETVFREARERAPAMLFLDELDAIAERRDGLSTGHERQHVAALLQQLDAARRVPRLGADQNSAISTSPVSATARVRTSTRPPVGVASIAFVKRFRITCWS